MKTAILSRCGYYRYRLTRGKSNLMPVVMLNPSTADAYQDDPTIRKLLKLAGGNGFGGIDVVNLYAFRATSPFELKMASDPYGPDNRDTHHRFCKQYQPLGHVVLAWGNHGEPEGIHRFMDVLNEYIDTRSRFGSKLMSCFGQNKNGSPKHPLYLKDSTKLEPYF